MKANDDTHFRSFASSLEKAIDKYADIPEEDFLARQKRQVETLVALEKEFRRTLIKHPWGPGAYKAFVYFICEDKRNILAARPFFRERQNIFTTQISKALKRRAEKSLYRFHFNYPFVLFVMAQYKWPKGGKIAVLARQIRALRTELVEMNMPLAISRARIFWSRTPKAQLSYMDLVQISCEGLMSAVDKFCLPYSRVFRAVAIGRMTGNFIENYSETLVHFYPVDKRKIYRANKLLSRSTAETATMEIISSGVNADVDPNHHTTPAEIADLLAAASSVSADSPMPNQDASPDSESFPLDSFRADESTHPDVRFEHAEAVSVLERALPDLPVIERKLLRMKGVSL